MSLEKEYKRQVFEKAIQIEDPKPALEMIGDIDSIIVGIEKEVMQ